MVLIRGVPRMMLVAEPGTSYNLIFFFSFPICTLRLITLSNSTRVLYAERNQLVFTAFISGAHAAMTKPSFMNLGPASVSNTAINVVQTPLALTAISTLYF